jgi:hypothetical protein
VNAFPGAQAEAPAPARRKAVLATLAGVAALTAAHVWIKLLHVPWERPVGALFDGAPATNEGWAAWYVAPIFAPVLALALLWLYFRRTERWTLTALGVAGLFAVVCGAWAAYWVKNIGYTWYFVPGASIATILGVQPQMAALALGRATHLLADQLLLLATGAAAGVLAALLLNLPLRAIGASAPPAQGTSDTAAGRETAVPQSAGYVLRLTTAVLMGMLAGEVASMGLAVVGTIVAPIAGAIWFFVSFRAGRYAFPQVAIGSAAIALVCAFPLGLMDPSAFIFSAVVRWPTFLLLSVGLIKSAVWGSRLATRVGVALKH